MSSKPKKVLIYVEAKVRLVLLSLCVYAAVYGIVPTIFPDKADSIVQNEVFILLNSIYSIGAGFVLREEIEGIKKMYEWDWTAASKFEYLCTEIAGLISIGLFFFVVQMSIHLVFFPGFDQIVIGVGDYYWHPYIFAGNSILIYIIYRLTIIKIELKETKEETK